MRDYIDLLVHVLLEQESCDSAGSFSAQTPQQIYAERAFRETLSGPQTKLFLAYEEAQNAASSLYAACLARQAFLLAKELYR